jgi:hypothetical protein
MRVSRPDTAVASTPGTGSRCGWVVHCAKVFTSSSERVLEVSLTTSVGDLEEVRGVITGPFPPLGGCATQFAQQGLAMRGCR